MLVAEQRMLGDVPSDGPVLVLAGSTRARRGHRQPLC